uniref:Uncharacterized protein n=1 Tax=Cajanus cajan TaxID=3821 RepID=A0A151S228_CAJCA|nr:hypothetical protein KK1_029489 [Cajanus cajan]
MTNATICIVGENNEPFVPIPGMEEASLKLYQSQVLIPFSLEDGSIRAFLGPFISQNKKKFINILLSEDQSTLPFVYSPKIDLSLLSDTIKIFRALPPAKDRHLQWLERVEGSMRIIWVGAGIQDFIQLFKFDLHIFDPQMILSAIFFLEKNLKIYMGNYKLFEEFFLFDLGGIDVILGITWLATLGEVKVNWRTFNMTFV